MADQLSPIKNNGSFSISIVPERTTNVSQQESQINLQNSSNGDSINEAQLLRSIQNTIKSFQSAHTQLEFREHEGTNRIIVKVLNSETGEIIREVPPEKNLDLLESLLEMAGILIDEKR